MSKITEGDKDLVAEVMSECCRKVAALIEGDFVHEFEIEMSVNGITYVLSLTKSKNT